MAKRYPILSLVLIAVGGAGLLMISSGGAWGPGWAPGMMGPGMMGGWFAGRNLKARYESNGERIYYTGISARTGPVPIQGGPMWLQHGPVGCVACHGVHGRGGIPVMMGTAIPEDIRYGALIQGEHEKGKEEMKHPPYTDALIKRAITKGIDPAGEPLDWTMPRWQFGDEDVADLLAYLKTLR